MRKFCACSFLGGWHGAKLVATGQLLPEQLKDAKGYLPGQIHGPLSAWPERDRIYFGYGTNARGVAPL